jgi:hypothetical protein
VAKLTGVGEPELSDTARVTVARARRRLLYGQWEADAIERIRARLGNIRRQAVGYPDLSANPFRSVCHQVAVLYDREPRISHPDDTAGRPLARALERKLRDALWTPTAQRFQRDTIGIREMLMHPHVTERGELVLRPVFPDRVEGEADDDRPNRLGTIREARVRKVGGRKVWTYDVIDPTERSYVVTDAAGKAITAEAIGADASGDDFPYLWENGEGFLPHVLYHATPTAELWDPNELRELYEATLESTVLWSFWGHCVRDASWPQRWTVDLQVQGLTTEGSVSATRQVHTTDPSVLLPFTRSNASDASSIPPGQFEPGADPLALAQALLIYERRLAGHAGVTDPEFIRESGDPRSGYALSISRDGQRSASRKFEPQFQAGDTELLGKCAALLNRHSESIGFDDEEELPELPERGWRVRYPGLPLTPDEQDARRRNCLELLDKGLISRVRAYADLHELDLEEAKAELAEIPDPALTPAQRLGVVTPGGEQVTDG